MWFWDLLGNILGYGLGAILVGAIIIGCVCALFEAIGSILNGLGGIVNKVIPGAKVWPAIGVAFVVSCATVVVVELSK